MTDARKTPAPHRKRRRLLAAAVLAAAVLTLLPAGTAEAACSEADAPEIRIRLELPEPELIHDYASDDIPEGTVETARRVRELNSRLHGLTVFQMETGHEVAVRQLRPGRDCFRLERLNVWIRVNKLRVYIARELARGSCLYDVTLRHESRHVDIYSTGVKSMRDEMAKALTGTPLTAPLRARSVQAALTRYSTAIGTVLSDIRQKSSLEMTRDNARLDTPFAYRAEQAPCF
ncbi:MAG: hypothetical protein ACMVY4_04735 [Minwuia sp.]|uniref:hypothetical protein n=1 Tax=Minwuia sp. TaxID=2493630 RepID=UPI003A86AFAC